MIVPASCCVWALNALQNSMMFTPCWPSAGPTGGAGLAAAAGICSLIIVRTFLAMRRPRIAARGPSGLTGAQAPEVLVGELDLQCGEVLLQMLEGERARDRND